MESGNESQSYPISYYNFEPKKLFLFFLMSFFYPAGYFYWSYYNKKIGIFIYSLLFILILSIYLSVNFYKFYFIYNLEWGIALIFMGIIFPLFWSSMSTLFFIFSRFFNKENSSFDVKILFLTGSNLGLFTFAFSLLIYNIYETAKAREGVILTSPAWVDYTIDMSILFWYVLFIFITFKYRDDGLSVLVKPKGNQFIIN